MQFSRRHLLLTCSAMVASPTLMAQQPPGGDKATIRILMGLPPGGGTDSIARYIAEKLREQLDQPVIIESRVGVGGRLAADALMVANPDGLTYMVAPNATPTFQTLVFGPQLKWNIWRDFTPVAGLVSYPLGMAVNADLGVKSAKEFVQWAKANPSKASFGTPGTGGQNHFLGVQFAKVAGVDLQVAPYKGTPPMITDMLGGHVAAGISLMDELLKVIRVIKKVDPDAPHETLLVLDATVGRNALAQENIFGNQIGVSGIVMTKLDGTARGGVLVPVAQASDSPIKLIGVGEGIEDLQPFDARAFARTVVGLGEG